MTPTNAEVITRAKQLFEEETGRVWKDGADHDETAPYIERARRELAEIEEEGHS